MKFHIYAWRILEYTGFLSLYEYGFINDFKLFQIILHGKLTTWDCISLNVPEYNMRNSLYIETSTIISCAKLIDNYYQYADIFYQKFKFTYDELTNLYNNV